jgi:hypothetical protein
MAVDDLAYVRDLKAFARGGLDLDDLPALEAELYGANDRASAVMLGSFLESSLTTFLTHQLRMDLNNDDRRRIFDHQGPLGTFASKIILTYALKLVGPITRHDLDLIRILRNEFAHSRKHFGFETPVVTEVCKHLQTPDLPDSTTPFGPFSRAIDGTESDKNHPRTRYRSACHTISVSLLRNASRLYRVGISADGPAMLPKPPLP